MNRDEELRCFQYFKQVSLFSIAVLYLDLTLVRRALPALLTESMAECAVDSNRAGIKDSRAILEDEPDRDEDVGWLD